MFGMNLLNMFCTLWKSCFEWIQIIFVFIMFIMLRGEVLHDILHLNCRIIFRGVRSYYSNSNFYIHECFLHLCSKAYHDLLSVCPCETSISTSSLAKGFAHGPLSLHPWQIELEFRIHALSISIGCSYY